MYLEENMTNLANNKESLFNTLKEYSTKRTELIATLFTIFPITEASAYIVLPRFLVFLGKCSFCCVLTKMISIPHID